MDKHRKVSKNWHIPSTFPSEAVTSAYLNPQVDQSTEIFSWAKPDLLILRKLCWEKFGWNRKKTDELLLPVLKEYEKHETQLRMEAFYTFNERFAKIRSKRIKKAVKRIGGALSSEVIDHTLQSGPGYGNKKRPAPHETEETTSDKDSDKTYEKEKNKRNRLKKSSSSRGRGRAQKRGQIRGKGRRNLLPELSGGSSDNICDDDDKVVDLQPPRDAKLDYPNKLRRSTRSRNPVNYTGREDDEPDESRGDGESPGEYFENVEFLKDGDRVGNVFAERAENKTKTVDASFNDCTSENYVRIGGGICTDEAEIGDAHLEDKATGDYRVMGGGFCVDEDETGGEDAEKLKMESEEHQNKAKCRNREDASLEENVDSEIGNSSVGGLSAMPFLKRKKSKVIKN